MIVVAGVMYVAAGTATIHGESYKTLQGVVVVVVLFTARSTAGGSACR